MIAELAFVFVDYVRPSGLFDPIEDRQPPLMTCGEPVPKGWLEVRITIDEFGAVRVVHSPKPPPSPRWPDCPVSITPQYVVCQEPEMVFVSDNPDTSWPTDCSSSH